MARPTRAGRRPAGVAYLGLLIALGALGAALGATGTLWREARQRELERELLFVGLQYRLAIQRYHDAVPGAPRYPPDLDSLLLDRRFPDIRRHLRRPYRDPLTGAPEWGLVPAPGGGILGVYSLAEGRPIRQANYPAVLGWADGAVRYADWRFLYVPPVPGQAR